MHLVKLTETRLRWLILCLQNNGSQPKSLPERPQSKRAFLKSNRKGFRGGAVSRTQNAKPGVFRTIEHDFMLVTRWQVTVDGEAGRHVGLADTGDIVGPGHQHPRNGYAAERSCA